MQTCDLPGPEVGSEVAVVSRQGPPRLIASVLRRDLLLRAKRLFIAAMVYLGWQVASSPNRQ